MRKRPISAFFSDFAKAVALQLRIDPMPPERRALEELFNSGGLGWHWYPAPRLRRGSGGSGAAAAKRAARKRRNVRARAAKR